MRFALTLLPMLCAVGCYSPWRAEPAGRKVCVDEVCDGYDNDCDGATDEGFDLASERWNCGACGVRCPAEQDRGTAACIEGACQIERCEPGFEDVDRMPSNGCEADCTPVDGGEVANGRDDDCDGRTDEGVETRSARLRGPDPLAMARVLDRTHCAGQP